jgi:hypothetical protein
MRFYEDKSDDQYILCWDKIAKADDDYQSRNTPKRRVALISFPYEEECGLMITAMPV